MKSLQISRQLAKQLTAVAGALLLLSVPGLNAQVQTETSAQDTGSSTKVTVQRAEVVTVEGNDLIVKMDDGQIRHFANVPESFRVNVNGQELGIHDLKPGMKLQRTTFTTTTDRTITTVKSVTGKVWYVNPPSSVIVTLENGENQEFKIPKGQKFNVNGQQVDAWGLKKGMTISATKVVEEPVTVVDQRRRVTGVMPPPPPAPPANIPILVVVAKVPAPPPQQVAEATPPPPPATLPKTGSVLPLIGLSGLTMLGLGFGMVLLRKRS